MKLFIQIKNGKINSCGFASVEEGWKSEGDEVDGRGYFKKVPLNSDDLNTIKEVLADPINFYNMDLEDYILDYLIDFPMPMEEIEEYIKSILPRELLL